jgi:protein-S-isoprenylcysteine O-methyltransferase Ste14
VFAAFYLWQSKPTWLSIVVGIIIASFGLATRALAAGHVKKDRELVTSGPYAYVRNPLYLGSILLGVGFTIAARSIWIALALVVYFVLIYIPVIRGEQDYLGSQFPGYAEYTQRVPSLLPRTLWFTGVTDGFSRELYFRHREYNSLLGAAAVLAVLIAKILLLG